MFSSKTVHFLLLHELASAPREKKRHRATHAPCCACSIRLALVFFCFLLLHERTSTPCDWRESLVLARAFLPGFMGKERKKAEPGVAQLPSNVLIPRILSHRDL